MEANALVVNNQTRGVHIPMKDDISELDKHDVSVSRKEEVNKPIIDEEIKKALPPLAKEEHERLEESILKDGCRDALVVWKEENILVDGYHRYQICTKHGIDYEITYMSFPTEQDAIVWRVENQLARRNMTDLQKDYKIGRLYNSTKQAHGGDRKSNGKNYHLKLTSEQIAEIAKSSEKKVRLNGEFAQAIDEITEITGNEFTDKILQREVTFTRGDIRKMAELSPEELKEIASHVGDEETTQRDVLKRILAEKEPKVSAPEESVEVEQIVSSTDFLVPADTPLTEEVQAEPSGTSDSGSEETARSNNDTTPINNPENQAEPVLPAAPPNESDNESSQNAEEQVEQSDTDHPETEATDVQEANDSNSEETPEEPDKDPEEPEIKKELSQLIALGEGLKQYHNDAEISLTGLGQHLAEMKIKISSLEDLIQEQEANKVGFEL